MGCAVSHGCRACRPMFAPTDLLSLPLLHAGTLPEEWAGAGLFNRLQFIYLHGNLYLTGPLPVAWASPDAFPSLIEMCVLQMCGCICY